MYDEEKLRALIAAHGETTAGFAIAGLMVSVSSSSPDDIQALHTEHLVPAHAAWVALDTYLKTGEPGSF